LKISAAEFTPNASKFKGELCKGVRFSVQDRASIQTVRTGIALATATQKLHTDKLELDPMQKLLLHPAALKSIREGQPVEKTMALWTNDLAEFKKRRASVLLYPES
jgi:uncharacterized protein YbbC (DUF1343 family)